MLRAQGIHYTIPAQTHRHLEYNRADYRRIDAASFITAVSPIANESIVHLSHTYTPASQFTLSAGIPFLSIVFVFPITISHLYVQPFKRPVKSNAIGWHYYRGAGKSLARPTSRCILFDVENISFDASLVMYITSANIPPIMIIIGGLEVACWPLVPKFAGSNPAETVGFLRVRKSSARLPSEGK